MDLKDSNSNNNQEDSESIGSDESEEESGSFFKCFFLKKNKQINK